MKHLVYKTLINIYRHLPAKKLICQLLKKSKIPNKKFYKDFKFKGRFKVEMRNKKGFFLWNHGGTIENETYWKGLFNSWETDTGWIWKELCVCSNTILDIGANTGIYSMTAKTINPDAKVYAFEPSINTFNKLKFNNDLNNFDIVSEQIALSNSNGKQIFYDTDDQNQTSASLSADKSKNWEGFSGKIIEYEVQTMKLSDYIKNNSIENIDLIKIDVEMHEPEVIEGLSDYLLKFKPIVIIEVLTEKVAEKLNSLINVKEHVIFHLSKTDNVEVGRFSMGKVYAWNYLFFHNDLIDKIKLHTSLYKNH